MSNMKATKKGNPRPKASGRSAPKAPKKTFVMNSSSAEFGRGMGYPVAARYQLAGSKRMPVRGDVFLGSDGTAWFAAINFRSDKFEILKPIREVPSAKRPGARRAKGSK